MKIKTQRGFVLTTEAVISLVIFALLILSLNISEKVSLEELAIVQQENDLLRVWSDHQGTEQEMINDTKTLFGNKGTLLVNSREILSGQKTNNCISSAAQIFFGEEKKEVIVTVCR